VVAVVVLSVLSLLLGVLANYYPGLAVGVALLFLVAVVSGLKPRVAFLLAAGFTLAVPTGWGMSRALPFLNVQLGVGSLALQVLLPLGAVLLFLVGVGHDSALQDRSEEGLSGWLGLLVLWLAVVAIGLVAGLLRFGLRDAFSDGQTYVLYATMLVPLLAPKAWRRIGSDRLVLAALVSLVAYGAWVLAVLMVGGLHEVVYPGTAMARTRVGFATTSLMVLFIPLAVTALESPGIRSMSRTLVWASIGVLGLSVMVSQSRAILIGVLLPVALVLVWPRSRGLARGKRVTSWALIGTLVVIGLGAVLSSPDLQSAASDFAGRTEVGVADPSYQSRVLTYSALWQRLTTAGELVKGAGIGSTAYTLTPSGTVAYDFYFVDNSVLTVVLKSGVLGAASLMALLAAMWLYAWRVARSGGAYARAVVFALPFFVGVTGLSSAQLVNAPSIPVGLAVVSAILVADRGDSETALATPECV
jgi:hypothetical protein